MVDKRVHRGPHPEDRQLFAETEIPRLRSAAHEFGWLLSHGYAVRSSIKLVGDRHALVERQRIAVRRCVCAEAELLRRMECRVAGQELPVDSEVLIDGFNVLTTIESALGGGVILAASDSCFRDMASMHGTYRRVAETTLAIELIGQTLTSLGCTQAKWLFDQPVSNSGSLAHAVQQIARDHQWNWRAELVPDPDPLLARSRQVIATADSGVLDAGPRWLNLARLPVEQHVPQAWVVDFTSDTTTR